MQFFLVLMSSYWDILHLFLLFCTKNSASNRFMFRCSQSNVLKFWMKHALKTYQSKWFNHRVKKQEVHGPHRSPEKTAQINKHIWLSKCWLSEEKTHYLLYEKWMVLHMNKLESPLPKDALCQVCWNWPSGSREEDF